VHAYEEYGVDCLAELRGMFAFALWDAKQRTVFCARDRVGIKPLYYTVMRNCVLFASELKSILTEPSVDKEIDHQAIDRALSFYYLPGDKTLFKHVHKLLPGHYAIIRDGHFTTKAFWDLTFAPDHSKSFEGVTSEALELIRESVRLHMISDVPVGFLLSGGVDSTALLSLAIHETGKEISTFTIGFEGQNFADERPYAQLAANRFGTKHFDMTMGARDFIDFMPQYISIMEEPVCEPPAIALYHISRLAREHVKVLISGEGGDEAFGGYPNYRNMLFLDAVRRRVPFGRELLSQASAMPLLRNRLDKFRSFIERPLAEAYYSRASSPRTFCNRNHRQLYTPEFLDSIDRGATERFVAEKVRPDPSLSLLNAMLYVDTKTWLPDDLLVKADKITMANSIELRVPLLDHKVLEFAGTVPERFKVRNFAMKRVLKNAFRDVVPQEILRRKKTGFPVPYAQWMRGEGRKFVRDTLLSGPAVSRGYFNKRTIEALMAENAGNGLFPQEIFTLTTLELWHRRFS